jgi:AraC family transcriptional regulator, positive regulator of tynA and feaB
MDPSSDLLSRPELHYEGWIDALRPDWGRYNPEAIKPETFAGRVRPRSVCGFTAVNLSCNAHRVERTRRDTRLDDMDHFYAVFQVAGGSTMIQNDQAVKLAVGDVAFVDSARPVTYVHENGDGQWFSLQLPRRSLVSHLGFQPQYSFCGRSETQAARLLRQLVLDAVHDEDATSATAEPYMQLAIERLPAARWPGFATPRCGEPLVFDFLANPPDTYLFGLEGARLGA